MPAYVHEPEPVSERHASRPGSGQSAKADELLERECPWPRRRRGHDGMPQMLACHRENKVGPEQAVFCDPAAAMAADVKAACGQRPHHLGRWFLADGEQAG